MLAFFPRRNVSLATKLLKCGTARRRPQGEEEAMSAWEYKRLSVWSEDYEATLNELGAQGWEVTQYTFHPGRILMRHPLGYHLYMPYTSYYTVLLRRGVHTGDGDASAEVYGPPLEEVP
jgi:hypothetical protein